MREALRHAVTGLVALFAGMLVWQGAALVPAMATQRSPSMGISLMYVFAAIPVAGAIMLALQVRELARAWVSPGLRLGVALAWQRTVAVVFTGRLVPVSPSMAVIALIGTMVLLIAVHTPIAFAVGAAASPTFSWSASFR